MALAASKKPLQIGIFPRSVPPKMVFASPRLAQVANLAIAALILLLFFL
jgi:hypothetical protein